MARKKTRTSLQDIADHLSISKNAVSLALNGKPGVGEDLRRRILEAAQELGYAGPSGESRETSFNFLALVPENDGDDDALYNHVFLGLERVLKEEGHHVMIANVGEAMIQSRSIPRIFKSFEFSGLVLIGDLPDPYIQSMAQTGLPLVLVDNAPYGMNLCSVGCAHAEAAYQVSSHCLARCSGELGFIGPKDGSTACFERWCGFRRALNDQNRPVSPELELFGISSTDPTDMQRRIQALPRLPQAFFCATDLLAIKLMGVLGAMGLRIPEDISVAGCDDIQAAHLISPALTTCRTPRVEMGMQAADLISRLAAGETPAAHAARINLYGELMIRASVK